MLVRNLTLLATTSVLGLLAIGAASAFASVALRTDPGGGRLTGSTTITNTTSDPTTLTFPGVGSFTCAQSSFDADVGANSSATSITGTLTNLTFTSCTDTLPVISFTSCHLSPTSPLPVIHIFADPNTLQITDPTIRCNIAGSTTSFCYYTFTSTTTIGVYINVDGRVTFSNTTIHTTSGAGSLGAACGSAGGSLNMTFTHVVQGGTNRTVTVATT